MAPRCAPAAAPSWRSQPTSSDALGPAGRLVAARRDRAARAAGTGVLAGGARAADGPGAGTLRRAMRFRMLGPLRDATLPVSCRPGSASDQRCLLRDIEFRCDDERIIYAQTVLPDSTLCRYPWLRELGDSPIGETLRRAGEPLERDPLEYAALPGGSDLALAALGARAADPDRGRALGAARGVSSGWRTHPRPGSVPARAAARAARRAETIERSA